MWLELVKITCSWERHIKRWESCWNSSCFHQDFQRQHSRSATNDKRWMAISQRTVEMGTYHWEGAGICKHPFEYRFVRACQVRGSHLNFLTSIASCTAAQLRPKRPDFQQAYLSRISMKFPSFLFNCSIFWGCCTPWWTLETMQYSCGHAALMLVDAWRLPDAAVRWKSLASLVRHEPSSQLWCAGDLWVIQPRMSVMNGKLCMQWRADLWTRNLENLVRVRGIHDEKHQISSSFLICLV